MITAKPLDLGKLQTEALALGRGHVALTLLGAWPDANGIYPPGVVLLCSDRPGLSETHEPCEAAIEAYEAHTAQESQQPPSDYGKSYRRARPSGNDDEQSTWIYPSSGLEWVNGVNWKHEGDEWLHYVQSSLSELVGASSFSTSSRGPTAAVPTSYFSYSVTSNSLDSELILIRRDDESLLAAIQGRGEPSSEQVDPWIVATKQACDRLGMAHPPFPWVAVVGPAVSYNSKVNALQQPATLGPLRISPPRVLMWERAPSATPSLYSYSSRASMPLIVQGEIRGYNWQSASLLAGGDLHRLCCLLSIAWDEPWIVRESVRSADWGEVKIPSSVGGEDSADHGPPPIANINVPDWLGSAWARLDDEKRFGTPLRRITKESGSLTRILHWRWLPLLVQSKPWARN